MIENTWTWANQQGKVYKHPVNQAEYVDLDVDSCREKQKRTVSELQSQSHFVSEDSEKGFAYVCL